MLLTVSLPAQLNTDRIMSIGRNALYFEDYVLSIQYFNQVARAKPHLAEPFFFRAIAKFYLDDYLGAIEDCNSALENNPFLVDAYNIRGISLQRLGRYEEANADFSKGLEYEPMNTSLIMNKGVSKMALKDYTGAIADFGEAIKLKQSFMLAYLNRGEAYLLSGDTLNAMPDFEKSIELNPYNPAGYIMRGRVKFQQKDYPGAEEDFDMTVRLKPDYAGFYINRGLTRYFQKDYMDALYDFDKAIELDPNNPVAYFDRGLIRAEIADNNRAIEDFNMVLRIEPENYIAVFNRGLIYNNMGMHMNAIDDFNRVINRYPDFPPAFYARAEARRKLGDEAGMFTDMNTAFAIETNAGERKKGDKKELKQVSLSQNDETPDKRDEKDTNISNFRKIVVLDEEREKEKSKFASDIRGQVQNRNIAIDLEPEFTLSFMQEPRKFESRLNYFAPALDAFKRNSGLKNSLYIVGKTSMLDEQEIEKQFTDMAVVSQRIDMYPDNFISYFERAVLYDMSRDFSSAINDLNTAIALKDNVSIAYFYRGVIRFKNLEFVLSLQDESALLNSTGGMVKNSSSVQEKETKILDYDLILYDYNRSIELEPSFAFAWYNRGNLRCILKDYKVAVSDYTEAIRLEPDLAEAYFNRGLTYIYLGNLSAGTRDLSKAGELGLFKAYNILKRYGLQGEK
jgi:tetratricopeptide (TPR) repeat protein